MGKQVQPVALDRRWDVSSLLGESFKLFWRHAGLFLPLTLIVAIPYVVGTDLIWGEAFVEADSPPWGGYVITGVLGATVVPALITALHVVSVLRLAGGERPSVGEAFALAADRAGPAILTTLLYMLVVAVGLLLIVPGVYLATRLYLGVQASVVDRLGPADALRRSAELTKDRWWQTFGRFLLAGIVFGLCAIPLSIPMGFVDFGIVYVLLDLAGQTIVLSLSALFGTLVFMDYDGHRAADRAAQPGPVAYGGFEPPRPPGPIA